MTDKKTRFAWALLLSAGLASALSAQDASAPPTTAPTGGIVSVSDKAALEASKDQEVTIEGVVREAAWSGSGKVMNITFEGAQETNFAAVVFSQSKVKMNQAFSGDAAKAWTGAKLRIRGKLRTYGGKVEGRKGQPEMTISDASQVTIVEPATTQPAQ